MDRRRFLEALIASGLAATLDPERLLWTPKALITVPAMPPRTWYVRPGLRRIGGIIEYMANGDRAVPTLDDAIVKAAQGDRVVWPNMECDGAIVERRGVLSLNEHGERCVIYRASLPTHVQPHGWINA